MGLAGKIKASNMNTFQADKPSEQECRLFDDEFNQFFENCSSIISSKESLMNYFSKIENIIRNDIGHIGIISMFRYLQAFSCEEYLYHINASDTEVSTIGLQAIDAAIQQCNIDEYIVLKQVLHSYNLRPDAPDILSIQKNYDKSCPDIQKLQDTLIDKEYLQEIYKHSRAVSLERTAVALEEKGAYQQALDAMKMMLDLDTPTGYISGSSFLYYAHFKREEYKAFWDEEKAFLYAKQGADYGIQFMKSNYDSENALSQVWMKLVKHTALRYQQGIGVDVNLSEAERYLWIGQSHGDEECKQLIQELNGRKKAVIDVFKDRCANILSPEVHGNDTVVYPVNRDFKTKRRLIEQYFQLEAGETILFARDTGFLKVGKRGLVITDRGITCIISKKECGKLFWSLISQVKYQQEGQFLFYDADENVCANIGISYFIRNAQESDLGRLGNALASAFTEMAQCSRLA